MGVLLSLLVYYVVNVTIVCRQGIKYVDVFIILRYVLNLADTTDGIIVSNDNYRDLMDEKPGWKKMIKERLVLLCC